MKKVLLFAAALFATISCTESSVTENVAAEAAGGVNMTFAASFADESTRVAVDEEFKVSWYSDYEGAAGTWYSDDLSLFPTVTLDAVSSATATSVSADGNTATFECIYESEATDAELRLVHPMDYYARASNSYTMNIAYQTEGLGTTDFSVTNTTFMVSAGFHAAIEGEAGQQGSQYTLDGDINMLHVGAAVKINASFDAVPSGATLKTVTLHNVVNEVTVDLSVAGVGDGFVTNESTGDIVVTVGAEATTEMTVVCNIFPTTFAAGSEVVVDFLFSDGSTASKTIAVAQETTFARATVNTINAKDCVVEAGAEKVYGDYSYGNLVAGVTGATLDVVIGEGCEGVAIAIYETAYWSYNADYIVSYIEDGYSVATIVTESGTVNLFSSAATSATSYTYVVLEIEDIVASKATVVGSLSDYTLETFTTLSSTYTADMIDNGSTEVVSFKVSTIDVSYIYITPSRTVDGVINSNIYSAYYGAVPTASLVGTTLAEYLVDNNYFASASSITFQDESYSYDETGEMGYISGLTGGTSYTVFTIAVGANGNFLGLETAEITTAEAQDVVYDYSLEPIVTVTARTSNSITISLDINNCAKVYLAEISWDSAYMTSYETAKTFLEGGAAGLSEPYVYCVSSTYTHTYSNLSEGDIYLYVLGVGADGSIGETVGYTFSSTGGGYTSASYATITQKSGAIDSDGFADVTFNVALSSDTVKAYVGRIDSAYILNDTPKAWGGYLMTNWSLYGVDTITASKDITLTMYGESFHIVVVTEDADGNYSSSPAHTATDWDALTPYVGPADSDSDDQSAGDNIK